MASVFLLNLLIEKPFLTSVLEAVSCFQINPVSYPRRYPYNHASVQSIIKRLSLSLPKQLDATNVCTVLIGYRMAFYEWRT